MRQSKLAEIKRKSIEPGAMRLGFDYAERYEGENLRPAQKALEFLSCGFDMLLPLTRADVFPSAKRGVRKRGEKLVPRHLLWTSADVASFLTQAIPQLAIDLFDAQHGGDGESTDPVREHYVGLQAVVREYFPLAKHNKEILDQCSAEFEVLQRHEPREEVIAGWGYANGYSAAILEGRNPDEDPALVAEQLEFARDYFINHMHIGTVQLALDWRNRRIGTWNRVAAGMLDIGSADNGKTRAYRASALAALIEHSRCYQERAQLDLAKIIAIRVPVAA